jgi:hypothetical protein
MLVRSRQHRSRRTAGGFTLIEAALTTVVIGVGFVAMLQLLATGTISNVKGASLTTGVNLAKNIRESTLRLPFASLPALNNETFSPPIDSRGEVLSQMEGWEQRIRVRAVQPEELTLEIVDSTPDALRVTVTVWHHQRQICELSWFAFTTP